MSLLTFVTATRMNTSEFDASSPLARSLKVLAQLTPIRLQIATENTSPLAYVYNAAIESSSPDEILVFVHDDVSVDDWMVGARLAEALARFDVVGVAGNRRRQQGQETWYMQPGRVVDGKRHIKDFDDGWLSGVVRHGTQGKSGMTIYGPAPASVCLLDGMFLAARGDVLKARGVRFDPELAFHFYDLDFCRTAEQAGLKLGTWPMALTHSSGGDSVYSNAWATACLAYLKKWGEPVACA
jgi:hypothetical protein